MNTNKSLITSIIGLALVTGALLLMPFIAMQFTDEVVWTAGDFIVAGILLFGTGLTYKLITGKSGEKSYRFAVGLALLAGLFLIWANLAVGLIGSEDNPFNLIYFGVIIVGLVGAFLVRFRSHGMSLTMLMMALVQGVITLIALILGQQHVPHSSVFEILGVNGFFIMLFVVSGLLFRYAAERIEQPHPD